MELRIGVGAVVVSGHQILLVKHAKPTAWRGFWLLPGGKMRPGELLEEAAKREVKEETNIDIEVGELIDATVSSVSMRKKIPKWIVLVNFFGKPKNTDVAFPAEEIKEAAWLPIDELPRMPLHEDTLRALRKAGIFREVQKTL